jgi:hypothetical protein
MSIEGLVVLALIVWGAFTLVKRVRAKVSRPQAQTVGEGVTLCRFEGELPSYGDEFASIEEELGRISVSVGNILSQLTSPNSATAQLAQKLVALDEKVARLYELLDMHAALARMRLGVDHKDPEGALARLKADLEKLRMISNKRYESLARKAGALMVEVEKVADEYEVSKLLSQVDALHHSDVSKALEKPR